MNSSEFRCSYIASEENSSRLGEIAEQVIGILQDLKDDIRTDDLADQVNVPKRRIYDVIAILKAANLIETTRDKMGTKVRWVAMRETSNKTWNFKTNRLKIKTSGRFTSVVNKGTEVIIESTETYITIEDI